MIAQTISHATKTSAVPGIVCPKANPQAELRLFCFPYSGAGASIFYPWLGQLPGMVEMCFVEFPGRGTRFSETPFTHLSPLVEAVAQALRPNLDKPFAFFGHSLGALVAFELARYLRSQHEREPIHLFASGHEAPQVHDPGPCLHALPDAEFVDRLRQFHGTPEEVLEHAELRALVLPILRADFKVCETYTYEPDIPLGCPISAYGGLRDEYISQDDLQAWREQTSGSFSLRMFPGDHFYLNTDRLLLLRLLGQELMKMNVPRRQETEYR